MGGERVKARKKNRQLISDGVGGGGNGIAVLLLFGGALAATAFVAAVTFAFNKNKKKDAAIHPKPKPQHQQQLSLDNSEEEEEEDDHQIETIQEGLRALLQPQTTSTNEGDASASGHGGVDMKSTINNTCITEEKIVAVPDHGNVIEEVQEIVLSNDSNLESDGGSITIEEECIDSQGSNTEAQDVEVEPQEEIQQLELQSESHGATDFVSEIDKEEDFNFEEEEGKMDIENKDNKMDTTDAAAIGWVSVTGEASSDEKDSDEPSAQDGEVVSEIDKEEDGSLLNSNEKQHLCHAHEDFNFKGGKMDHIQNGEAKIQTTDATIEEMTVTHEATSDEKGSDQSSAAHSFEFSTRVIPFLLLPLLFLIILLVNRTQQFFL